VQRPHQVRLVVIRVELAGGYLVGVAFAGILGGSRGDGCPGLVVSLLFMIRCCPLCVVPGCCVLFGYGNLYCGCVDNSVA